MARGTVRRGFSDSSPRAAEDSKPLKARNAKSIPNRTPCQTHKSIGEIDTTLCRSAFPLDLFGSEKYTFLAGSGRNSFLDPFEDTAIAYIVKIGRAHV